MKDVEITVLKKAYYQDLSAAYENPLEEGCVMREGKVFLSKEAQLPHGFCENAWATLFPFVRALALGEEGLYDGWMKDPSTLILSCNDGVRPVSFLLRAVR